MLYRSKLLKIFFFFLLFIPVSFGVFTNVNLTENFPMVSYIKFSTLANCTSKNMTSNYEYTGSAGTWNVCKKDATTSTLNLNVSDYGGQSVNNQRVTWRDAGVSDEDELDNIVFYMDYTDNQGFYLSNNSMFSFSGRTTSSTTPAFNICWFFINSSGSGVIFAHAGSNCELTGAGHLFDGASNVVGYDFNDDPYMQSLSFTIFNSTNSSITSVNPNGNLAYFMNTYYDYVGFTTYHLGVGASSYIDQINLSGSGIGYNINEYPEFNFSVSTDDCYNSSLTGDTIDINLNISVSDAEGDTIYYALDAANTELFYVGQFDNDVKVYQCKPKLTRLLPFAAYPFLPLYWNVIECGYEEIPLISTPDVHHYNNACRINDPEINQSEFYYTGHFNKNDAYLDMILLNPLCTRHRELYLDLDTDLGYLDDFSYLGDFYLRGEVGNSFNITFYNDVYTDTRTLQVIFKINQTNNISVYGVNTTGENYLGNFIPLDVDLEDHIMPIIQYDRSLNMFNITFSTEYSNVTYTHEGFNDVGYRTKYAGYAVPYLSNNWLYIENFMYGGMVLTPEFSTTIPETTDVRSNGYVDVTLYVTDDYHYDLSTNNYNFEVESLYIPLCKYDAKPKTDDDVNIFARIKRILGGPMKNFLIDLGQYENGKQLLWYIFIFLLIAATITEYIFTKRIDLAIPLVSTGFLVGIAAWLVDYNTHLIVCMITMAFGIALPFADAVLRRR